MGKSSVSDEVGTRKLHAFFFFSSFSSKSYKKSYAIKLWTLQCWGGIKSELSQELERDRRYVGGILSFVGWRGNQRTLPRAQAWYDIAQCTQFCWSMFWAKQDGWCWLDSLIIIFITHWHIIHAVGKQRQKKMFSTRQNTCDFAQ
jgi:hypothetical protein